MAASLGFEARQRVFTYGDLKVIRLHPRVSDTTRFACRIAHVAHFDWRMSVRFGIRSRQF